MKKFMLTLTLFSIMAFSAQAQNVTVKDEVFGENDEVGTKSVQPTVNRVYKIDNLAKKKAELQKQKETQVENENSLSEQSEGLKKNTTENDTPATSSGDETPIDDTEASSEYQKRSLEEIQENLKLSPQELLEKVREDRQKKEEAAKKESLKSSRVNNQNIADYEKARLEDRRNMTKAERRALKEEQKKLEKARKEARRNMTKAERRALKEEQKMLEKAQREEQKANRKKRRKMRDMD